MNGSKRYYCSYRTLVVCLSVASLFLPGVRGHQAPQLARPVGRFTAQQVMSLSDPLCRAVTGSSAPLTMTAEAVHVQAHDLWNVVCLDVSDHELLNLTWDADTGEISHVGASAWEHQSHTGPLLTAKQASAVGCDWLSALSSGIPSAHWRPMQARICNHQQNWYLEYYATPGRRAIINVEAHTGALEYAKMEVNRSGE